VHHLAQVNVARMRGDLDSPAMQAFVAAADPVYRLAEASPGFIWRLTAGEGHVPVVRPDGGDLLVVLRRYGPSVRAFSPVRRFEPDGRPHGRRVRSAPG
jgi:hypothetical protein